MPGLAEMHVFSSCTAWRAVHHMMGMYTVVAQVQRRPWPRSSDLRASTHACSLGGAWPQTAVPKQRVWAAMDLAVARSEASTLVHCKAVPCTSWILSEMTTRCYHCQHRLLRAHQNSEERYFLEEKAMQVGNGN